MRVEEIVLRWNGHIRMDETSVAKRVQQRDFVKDYVGQRQVCIDETSGLVHDRTAWRAFVKNGRD